MAGSPSNLQLAVGGAGRGQAGVSSPSTSQSSSKTSSPSDPRSLSDGMDCFGNERQMLTDMVKFFNNELLSDVRLRVGDQVYFAHKLVLVRASDVFEKMLTSEWQDANQKEVQLVEDGLCVRVFSSFLRFLYTCHVQLNTENTLPILVLADKYNVEDLRRVCVNFACSNIIPKLQLKDVFHVWFQYATKCYHQELISACVMALSEKMDDITYSSEWEQEWISLEKDQLMEFLKSSDLTIKDEYELWQAVVRWLYSKTYPKRLQQLEENLKEVLPYIRFPMMQPDQLHELESYKLVEQFPGLFLPHLMQAYKYNSLSLASRTTIKEFNASTFLLRNYSELRWDKRLVVRNYSQCQKCCEVSLRFSTRSSSFPSQTWEWELKVYPKGFSSTSEDLRCILYSNLILDQPRPVEYLLSVVDEENLLCSVSGKRNFSKKRYTTDTEIEKKITVADLCMPNTPYLVRDNLIFQIALRPVE